MAKDNNSSAPQKAEDKAQDTSNTKPNPMETVNTVSMKTIGQFSSLDKNKTKAQNSNQTSSSTDEK